MPSTATASTAAAVGAGLGDPADELAPAQVAGRRRAARVGSKAAAPLELVAIAPRVEAEAPAISWAQQVGDERRSRAGSPPR